MDTAISDQSHLSGVRGRHFLPGLLVIVSLSCPAEAGQGIGDAQQIVTPVVMKEIAYRIRTAVQVATGEGFGKNVPAVVSTISTYGDTTTSTADVPDPASTRWDLWLSGTYTHMDDDQSMSSYDGPVKSAVFGIGYQATDRLQLGVMGNVARTDIDTTFATLSGSSESDQVAVGVYAGLLVTDYLVADLAYVYNWGDNDIADSTDTASYDSEGWSLTGNLTGYWFTGNWRWSPSIGVSWSENRDDAYVDMPGGFAVPSQSQTTGVFNFGGQAGHTFALSDTNSMEIWAGAQGEWTFEQDVSTVVVPTVPVRNEDFDVRLSGGVDFVVGSNLSLSISGDVAGLAIDNFLTYSATGRASVQF